MSETKASVNITSEFVIDGFRYFVGTITHCRRWCTGGPKYIQLSPQEDRAQVQFMEDFPKDVTLDQLVELQIVARTFDYPNPVVATYDELLVDDHILVIETLEGITIGMKFCLEGKIDVYLCESCRRITKHDDPANNKDQKEVYLVVATRVPFGTS